MSLVVHLLGAPHVERDGQVHPPPRGRKAWGLLAYLVLSRPPVSRRAVCSLLFADADDPLAALRWNLTEVRKLLGDPAVLRGDPLVLEPGVHGAADVHALLAGDWQRCERWGGPDRELLESLSFDGCPAFEVWLQSERRHVRGVAESLLRETALARLAAGEGTAAAALAARLVRLNPYDENFQALLVRSLAAAGDGVGAARQVAACRELFRRELGVEPGPALQAAAGAATAAPLGRPKAGPAGVVAQLDAGEAAIGAGAVEAGLQCLRRAVAEVQGLPGEPALQVRALTALGTALVHSVRGQDEEGATALHRALALAESAHPRAAPDAALELGYIEFLRGRYDQVERWLERAEAAGCVDALRRARVLSLRGSALSDVGRYDAAAAALREAVRLTPDLRRRSYALSMLGRVHLLRAELDEAGELLAESYDLALQHGWTSFLPWPGSLLAGVELAAGDVDAAESRLDHAFALGCQVGDPCWEGVSARGLGLVASARGDVTRAVEQLQDARVRCTRLPDGYRWVDLYALEALCQVAARHGLAEQGPWAQQLSAAASHSGMREFEVRALLHRAAAGEHESLEVAVQLCGDVQSEALARAVEQARTPVAAASGAG